MKIEPYSFMVDNTGEYWIINHIERRVLDFNYIDPAYVGVGYKLPKELVSLSGPSRKEYINLRTCSFQQLNNFINHNTDKVLSWIYLNDIDGVIEREPFNFEVPTIQSI